MAQPYSLHLDPDVAQQLADQGGALLILDMPEGSYFGVDHMAFHCGPRFRGVKMLPPGPHFICYSIPGSQHHGGGMSPVTGFFLNVTSGAAARNGPGAAPVGSVHVRRYDPAQELLVELPDEEAELYARGVRQYEFDWGLAPYNLNAWRQWRELTSCLDARIIDAVQPVGGDICTAMEASLEETVGGGAEEAERPVTAAEARLRQQLLAGATARAARRPTDPASGPAADSDTHGGEGANAMEVEGGTAVEAGAHTSGHRAATESGASGERIGSNNNPASASGRCFYSVLPRLVKEAGLTAQQLTALNLDRTHTLHAMAAARWGGDARALVGELQFAFIAFVFGQSLAGFRQWRALVTLFLNCESGPLNTHVPTFVAFTAALRAQLSLALSDTLDPASGSQSTSFATNNGGMCEEGGSLRGGGDVAAAPLVTHGSLVQEVLLAGGGRDCFLRHHIGTYLEVLREAGPGALDSRLAAEAKELSALLSQVVGWQFDGLQVLGEDDDDEYAPVVVELSSEQGRELGFL